MSTESLDTRLEQARESVGRAHNAWGDSQLDDSLVAAVRELINVVMSLGDAVAELAAVPKPVGPFEAGKTYALIMMEEFFADRAVTNAVLNQLDGLNEQTGATFVIFPPGTRLGLTQEE
jgi:hypothetical protein